MIAATASRHLARWRPELLVAVALAVLPFIFVRATGSVDLLSRILIWGLFGLGFDLLFGYTGLLSFGQAAFYGTGGFVTAYLLTGNVMSNVWLAMVVGVAIAAMYSLIVGFLALRRTGIYFAMITLAFGELAYFLENSPLAAWTGGENGLPGIPTPSVHLAAFDFSFNSSWRIYELTALVFLVGYALCRSVVLSPVGCILGAIRENPARTAALGHDVQRYKLTVFVFAASYAGLAGALLGIFQSYMPPSAFSLETSGELVIQTVIGGTGTLLGPTIGAAIWLALRDLLQQLPLIGDLWKFVLGMVFVVLITLLRKGVAGELGKRWRSWSPKGGAAEQAVGVALGKLIRIAAEAEPATLPSSCTALALEARDVSKFYDGVHAVDHVSFMIPSGVIYAIIGPNGAGKSTFLRLLAGEESPNAGKIFLKGKDITDEDTTATCQQGLSKSYQINQLFPHLSVRQNLRVGALGRYRGRFHLDIFRAVDSIPAVERLVAALLEELELSGRGDRPVQTLSYGEKRRLELGLALACRPSVLLLDEPLAGLSPIEREEIKTLIRRLRENRAIVLVEHDMDAVFELAERIMVLHEGHTLATGTPGEIQKDPQVQLAYLGGVAWR
jgi:branched-chain amino acid transport system permease protein